MNWIEYRQPDSLYQMNNGVYTLFYCGQTMFKFPWMPTTGSGYEQLAVRGNIHPKFDLKLVKRFIRSIKLAYDWQGVEIELKDRQLTCHWKPVPKQWIELYILLCLIRLPYEHPYALIQYQKIRKFLPRDVALAFCTCYNGIRTTNHLLRDYPWKQQHLVDFSFASLINAPFNASYTGLLNTLYGLFYAHRTIHSWTYEMTPELYQFLLQQKGKSMQQSSENIEKLE